MQKSLLLTFLLISSFLPLVAVENVLVDFTALSEPDHVNGLQNAATYRDFSDNVGLGYTDEELDQMNISLYVPNWRIELSSSSNFVENNRQSLVDIAPVEAASRMFAGEKVLGLRVNFPEGKFNSYGVLVPPFAIPSYNPTNEDDGTFIGNGLLENVGTLKALKVNVAGRNFPVKMIVVLRDADYNEVFIDLGLLDFRSWQEIDWRNPNYKTDVRKRELVKQPLYPNTDARTATMSLDRIIFFRDANFGEITDFVSYVKDISLVYDTALAPSLVDIDDESIWGIAAAKQERRAAEEDGLLGTRQVLEFLEEAKLDRSEDEAPAQQGAPAQQAAPAEQAAPAQ